MVYGLAKMHDVHHQPLYKPQFRNPIDFNATQWIWSFFMQRVSICPSLMRSPQLVVKHTIAKQEYFDMPKCIRCAPHSHIYSLDHLISSTVTRHSRGIDILWYLQQWGYCNQLMHSNTKHSKHRPYDTYNICIRSCQCAIYLLRSDAEFQLAMQMICLLQWNIFFMSRYKQYHSKSNRKRN